MKVIIDADKLSKHDGTDGKIKAADELDLQVYEGETFGLLGPNGAGKATTIRLMTGGEWRVRPYSKPRKLRGRKRPVRRMYFR
ncbi:MAG: ATP-binding cassette domain-containing protein [Candidatus Thermoplasmatota archaeon]|nr:ATP-binding cassette domain-containing protein [Candidatus Thermoplasmatota archaeon]